MILPCRTLASSLRAGTTGYRKRCDEHKYLAYWLSIRVKVFCPSWISVCDDLTAEHQTGGLRGNRRDRRMTAMHTATDAAAITMEAGSGTLTMYPRS